MNLQKVAGAPNRLNSITRLLYRPNQVQNVVKYSQPFFIRTLLKAAIILILEKYFIPFRLFRLSFTSGSRQRSFIDMLFSSQQSTQNQRPLSGFLINKTGEAAGEKLSWINPFQRFSSSHSFKALSSSQDIRYSSLKSGVLLSSRRILWLCKRCGGSFSASLGEKTSQKSLISGGSRISGFSGLAWLVQDRQWSIYLIVTVNMRQFLCAYVAQALSDTFAMS